MHRLSMQQCLEIWLTVLLGLFFKLDVLSSTSTGTDMKPRSKVEPGRDEQRFKPRSKVELGRDEQRLKPRSKVEPGREEQRFPANRIRKSD